MDSNNSGQSVDIIEHVKKLCTESTDYQNCFYPLIFQAYNYCIIVLKKGNNSCLPMQGYGDKSLFFSTYCYTALEKLQPKKYPQGSSLNTIAMVIYPSGKPDVGTPESFWEGNDYILDGFSLQLLENKFSPSVELEEGFSYEYENMVVRGHTKHISAEYTALGTLKGEMEALLQTMKDKFSLENSAFRLKFAELNTELGDVTRILSQPPFNSEELEKQALSNLQNIYNVAENINRLRLGDTNTVEVVNQRKQAEELLTKQSNLLRKEYFNTVLTTEQVNALRKASIVCQQTIDAVNSLTTMPSFQKEMLQSTWESKMHKFRQIVINNDVASAQGPCLRVYQNISVSNMEQIKEGILYIASGIFALTDQSKSDYLHNSEYRTTLLQYLENEKIFFDRFDQKMFILNPEQYRQSLIDLKQLNQFWDGFESLNTPNGVHLPKIQELKRELATEFQNTFNRLEGCIYFLVNLARSDQRLIVLNNFEQVLVIILNRISLIDKKLILSNQCIQTGDKICYLDLYYSEQRNFLDSQLFLLLNSYLQVSIRQSNTISPSINIAANFLKSYLSPTRTYSALSVSGKFVTAAKELSRFLKGPIKSLDEIEKIVSANYSSKLNSFHLYSNQILKNADKIESSAKDEINLIKSFDSDPNPWEVYKNLVLEQRTDIQHLCKNFNEMGVFLSTLDINQQTSDTDLAKEMIDWLKLIRVTESKRAVLWKECDNLIQVHQSDSKERLNKVLKEARDTVSTLKNKLTNIKKGMSSYDLSIRETAVDKLNELEATLTVDPARDLLLRCQQILALLEQKMENNEITIADIQTSLQKCGFDTSPLPNPADNKKEYFQKLTNAWKKLEDDTKSLIKQRLLQNTINIVKLVIKHLSSCRLNSLRTQLINHGQNLTLDLNKREWFTSEKKMVAYYSWENTEIIEDSWYCRNSTHIPLF